MFTVWNEFLLWPFAARVALLLAIIWLFWLFLGRLIIRGMSLLPYCLRKVLLAIYLLIDYPISMLHSKVAGLFVRIDTAWTAMMSKLCSGLQLWYMVWRHPQKHYSFRVFLLLGIVFIWIVLPSFVNMQSSIVRQAEGTYIQIEQWVTEKTSASNSLRTEIELATPPLIVVPEITPSATPEPTPLPERVVSGLKTRLLVRDKPSVSAGETLTYLVNGDIVYDLGDQEQGDTGGGKSELWLKIQTMDGIVGWVRENYLAK